MSARYLPPFFAQMNYSLFTNVSKVYLVQFTPLESLLYFSFEFWQRCENEGVAAFALSGGGCGVISQIEEVKYTLTLPPTNTNSFLAIQTHIHIQTLIYTLKHLKNKQTHMFVYMSRT